MYNIGFIELLISNCVLHGFIVLLVFDAVLHQLYRFVGIYAFIAWVSSFCLYLIVYLIILYRVVDMLLCIAWCYRVVGISFCIAWVLSFCLYLIV